MENLNNSVPFRFRATPKIDEEINNIALLKCIKKSELLREILREYIERQNSKKEGK